jgi:hypothetical protein
MERIKAQADKLWQLISKADTLAAYKNVVTLTWEILKETALLVWLTICLILVVFEWFWKFSVGSGRSARDWFSSIEGSSDQLASETGKAFLAAGKNSLDFALVQAKTQLGFSIEEAPKVAVKPEVTPKAAPVAAKAPTAAAKSEETDA